MILSNVPLIVGRIGEERRSQRSRRRCCIHMGTTQQRSGDDEHPFTIGSSTGVLMTLTSCEHTLYENSIPRGVISSRRCTHLAGVVGQVNTIPKLVAGAATGKAIVKA